MFCFLFVVSLSQFVVCKAVFKVAGVVGLVSQSGGVKAHLARQAICFKRRGKRKVALARFGLGVVVCLFCFGVGGLLAERKVFSGVGVERCVAGVRGVGVRRRCEAAISVWRLFLCCAFCLFVVGKRGWLFHRSFGVRLPGWRALGGSGVSAGKASGKAGAGVGFHRFQGASRQGRLSAGVSGLLAFCFAGGRGKRVFGGRVRRCFVFKRRLAFVFGVCLFSFDLLLRFVSLFQAFVGVGLRSSGGQSVSSPILAAARPSAFSVTAARQCQGASIVRCLG